MFQCLVGFALARKFIASSMSSRAPNPEHLAELGIGKIREDLSELEELGILVDGSGPDSYLLQIFLKEAAAQQRRAEAGPFFFEIIQRQGDTGFGAGNFRALFDSVEGQQLARTA